MGLGSSLFLIAIGAILRFAVTASTSGIDVRTVGLILMIVGGVGLVISLFWITARADRGNATSGPIGDVPINDRQPERY